MQGLTTVPGVVAQGAEVIRFQSDPALHFNF